MAEENKKNNRGGYRPGAGRKPSGKKGKSYSFYLTPEQYKIVKALVDKLRSAQTTTRS